MQSSKQQILNEKLVEACKQSDLKKIKKLVSQGADVKINHDFLLFPASVGNLDVVKYLIEIGANIKKSMSFIYSASYGHIDVVKYLYEGKFNIILDKESALLNASCNGWFNVVKYLVEIGADIHTKKDMSLTFAANANRIEIVKYLIEKGANINAQNKYTLKSAANHGSLEIVKYLVVEHGQSAKIARKAAKDTNQIEVVNWCNIFIKSKELNEKLDQDLKIKIENTSCKKQIKL